MKINQSNFHYAPPVSRAFHLRGAAFPHLKQTALVQLGQTVTRPICLTPCALAVSSLFHTKGHSGVGQRCQRLPLATACSSHLRANSESPSGLFPVNCVTSCIAHGEPQPYRKQKALNTGRPHNIFSLHVRSLTLHLHLESNAIFISPACFIEGPNQHTSSKTWQHMLPMLKPLPVCFTVCSKEANERGSNEDWKAP